MNVGSGIRQTFDLSFWTFICCLHISDKFISFPESQFPHLHTEYLHHYVIHQANVFSYFKFMLLLIAFLAKGIDQHHKIKKVLKR